MTQPQPQTRPRIAPRPVEDWTDEVDEAFSALRAHVPGGQAGAPDGPPVRPRSNILGIYAWHPALVRGWMPFSNHLRHSTLSDRIREIAIIRTTWLGFGEYEWAQHVRMSRAGGYLTDAEIDALAQGPGADAWSAADAAVVRAVDELCADKNISDATWQDLEEQFSREQLIDFVFTVGTYDMHCMAFNALGLELEDGMVGFPDDHRRGR
ncbi:carboxymuconolactone decarboxylase family protein [Actinospica durhamensis]|uniref:Carboxymuconolactone decarboxylase family protein n=1 Tax=Actinospica durhamensis TaxID=1508375 RepID=A0A941EL24_9ACTN|nr:carboxymuconolactone decarboxylase family protein [Actinospica durhamensis]MBR7833121.1 carboxymuconolactone decarboxylase family protein [Actinospica durhamensis]